MKIRGAGGRLSACFTIVLPRNHCRSEARRSDRHRSSPTLSKASRCPGCILRLRWMQRPGVPRSST